MPPFAWWIWTPCVRLERFDFPGLGGIHEIRLLDIADTCHGGPVIRVPHRLLEQGSAASAASNSQCYA